LLAIVKSNNHDGSDFLGVTPTNLNLKGGGLVAKSFETSKGLGERLSHNIKADFQETKPFFKPFGRSIWLINSFSFQVRQVRDVKLWLQGFSVYFISDIWESGMSKDLFHSKL